MKEGSENNSALYDLVPDDDEDDVLRLDAKTLQEHMQIKRLSVRTAMRAGLRGAETASNNSDA